MLFFLQMYAVTAVPSINDNVQHFLGLCLFSSLNGGLVVLVVWRSARVYEHPKVFVTEMCLSVFLVARVKKKFLTGHCSILHKM